MSEKDVIFPLDPWVIDWTPSLLRWLQVRALTSLYPVSLNSAASFQSKSSLSTNSSAQAMMPRDFETNALVKQTCEATWIQTHGFVNTQQECNHFACELSQTIVKDKLPVCILHLLKILQQLTIQNWAAKIQTRQPGHYRILIARVILA